MQMYLDVMVVTDQLHLLKSQIWLAQLPSCRQFWES